MSARKKSARIYFIKGILATNIFLIHVAGSIREYWYLRYIVDIGKYAIYGFFVLSAFLATTSLIDSNRNNYIEYLVKRVRRIIPIYYLILLISIIVFVLFGVTPASYFRSIMQMNLITAKEVLYHMTFLNLLNHKYMASLLGVEWTLSIEMAYFILLPLLVFIVKKSNAFVFFLCGLGLLSFWNMLNLPIYLHVFGGGEWRFERYLFFYVVGILVAFINKSINKQKNVMLMDVMLMVGITSLLVMHDESPAVVLLMIFNFACFKLILTKSNLQTRPLLRGNISLVLIATLSVILTIVLWTKDATMALLFSLCTIFGLLIRGQNAANSSVKLIIEVGKVSYPFFLSHFLINSIVISLMTPWIEYAWAQCISILFVFVLTFFFSRALTKHLEYLV